MKTAISIPDPVFQAAESLAKQLGISRSELYSKAVEAFVNLHKNKGITEILNKVYSEANNSLEDDYCRLQIHSLNEDDW